MTVLTGNRTPRADDTPSSTRTTVTATRILIGVVVVVVLMAPATQVNNYGTEFVRTSARLDEMLSWSGSGVARNRKFRRILL